MTRSLPFFFAAVFVPLTLTADLRIGAETPVTPPSIGSLTQERGLIASDGDGFLIAWTSVDDESHLGSYFQSSDVRASRLNAGGENLDPMGFVIAGDATAEELHSLLHCGDTYAVVWERLYGLYLSRVDRRGNISEEQWIADPFSFPKFSCAGGRLVAAEKVFREDRLRVTLFDEDDRPLESRSFPIGGDEFLNGFFTVDDSAVVILYRRIPTNQYETLLIRFRFGEEPEAISLGTALGWTRDVELGTRTILVSAIAPPNADRGATLALLDRTDLTVVRTVSLPDVIGIATVVARDGGFAGYARSASAFLEIALTEQGRLSTRVIGPIDANVESVSAATNGTNDIVLIMTHDYGRAANFDLFAYFSRSERIEPVAMASRGQRHPALASDGENYMAVWSEDDPDSGGYRILSRLLDRNGEGVAEAREISTPRHESPSMARAWPTIAFDGVRHLAVWQEMRGGSRSRSPRGF